MKRILYLLFLLCIIPCAVFAQTYQISGVVTDVKDGSPLPGVAVQTQERVATMTDIDGQYSIKANKGDILTFSLIGMKRQEVKVESERNINIAMEDENINLDEVVVIGYGTVKKRDLSGAVGQVKADDLLKGNPMSSINQALQGKMAGVSVIQNDGAPGAGISILVRGANSFKTNSQPLYIVDGVPYHIASMPTNGLQNGNNQTANALANINPHDIESIEVLKDASATAIYGSRGANGVVLITTKRGQQGSEKIEFTANFSMSNRSKKMDVLDPVTYARYVNEGVTNREFYDGVSYYMLPYPGQWSYRYDTNNNILTDTGKYLPGPEDFLNLGMRTDQYGNTTSVMSTDWQDGIFQTAYSQEYNLSVSGASDKGWHSFSGNFMDQTGIIVNSAYKRYSLRTNLGRKLRSWLEVGTNLSYTNSVTDFAKTNSSESSVVRSALVFPPTYDPLVGRQESNELNWLAANPYVYVRNTIDQLRSNNVFSSSYAEVKFTDYLKFRQNLGLSYSSNNRYTFYSRLTQEGYPPTNGRIGQSDNWYQGTTAESIMTFEKTFNKVHALNVVAGFTFEEANWGNKSVSGYNLPTDITGPYNIGAALTIETPSSGRGMSRMVSLLGRANYVYNDRYIATASYRRDGSSRFIEGNKFANFASGALAWRISEEKLIKDLNIFDNLKLRLSYGQTGNQGINSYQTLARLGTNNYPIGSSQVSGFSENVYNGALNPNLKWETTDQYNIGLDISFLKGRINLTADYYYKKTKDLLQNVSIPTNSGFTNMWSNAGWVKNNGLELTGKFYAVTTKDFSWDIDANISFNKNEIGGLAGDQFADPLWYAASNVFIQRNGAPIGAMYGYVEDGFYDNEAEVRANPIYANATNAVVKSMVGEIKYRDLDGDGAITAHGDRTIIGDANPDFVYGITNNLRWKGFSLSFFFQGAVGNDVYNANLMEITMTNIANIPRWAYEKRWTPENRDNAQWPKAISGGYTREWKISDRYVEDGSYLRLKNLNIGYTFNPKFKAIGDVQVYASATNLFTITGYKWFDPDVNAFGGDMSRRGVDLNSYPSSRTFSLGLKVGF